MHNMLVWFLTLVAYPELLPPKLLENTNFGGKNHNNDVILLQQQKVDIWRLKSVNLTIMINLLSFF